MDRNSVELVAQHVAGDELAAREIHERFAKRLLGLAKVMLSDKLAARLDPEDVVQSAYRSFFVKTRTGQLAIRESGELWRLLSAITRHKALHAVERETTDKRQPERETSGAEMATTNDSPAEVAAVADELAAILAELSAEQCRLFELRLHDEPPERIAIKLNKSPRTVRRMLLELRQVFERRMSTDIDRQLVSNSPTLLLNATAQLDYRDFQLEQLAGMGGFGKVYRAYWKSRQQTVAVKALRRQFMLDLVAVKHFVREAHIIGTLDHPGLIRAYGLGRLPTGGYFLVLDWHAGGDLSRVVNFSFPDALCFVEQAAEAIAHAHQHGVVHGDLKPSNLLLSHSGQIVVTDFGFATAQRSGEDRAHCAGGTVGFSAPEVWQGAAPLPASDVYSLGRVLNDLMGRATVDVSLREWTIYERVQPIIQQCLESQSDRRCTAKELATKLGELRNNSQ